MNREITKEVLARIQNKGEFSAKRRFLLPDDTMTTELLTSPDISRRGQKMQSKFGGCELSVERRNMLGHSSYFVFGLPRISTTSLSGIFSESTSVALDLLDDAVKDEVDDVSTVAGEPEQIKASQRPDQYSTSVKPGVYSSTIKPDYSNSVKPDPYSTSVKPDPYSRSVKHGQLASSQKPDQYSSNKYWDARLGNNPVSRSSKKPDNNNYYFGGFVGGANQNDATDDLSRSRIRKSFRSNEPPIREDENEPPAYVPGRTLEEIADSRKDDYYSRGFRKPDTKQINGRPLPPPPPLGASSRPPSYNAPPPPQTPPLPAGYIAPHRESVIRESRSPNMPVRDAVNVLRRYEEPAYASRIK